VVSQSLLLFSENKKWGFKKGQTIIIKPEYDTAYGFDKTNQIALVANKSEFKKEVNPLTGEEIVALDYFYINQKNQKIKLLSERFPDSMITFPNQQELQYNYQDSSNYFKILFQNKLHLFNKKGQQLSVGFDNIKDSKIRGYFETENNIEFEKKTIRINGLIDSNGLEVIKCKYHEIAINIEDTSIYCCSAVYNNKLNDDVYDCKGKLIYADSKHIVFSSKNIHVMKSYDSSEFFIIKNSDSNELYKLDGNDFYYLRKNKALVVNKNNWFIFDIISKEKQKVDKKTYFINLVKMIEFLCNQ
jgi:hypothetical protein